MVAMRNSQTPTIYPEHEHLDFDFFLKTKEPEGSSSAREKWPIK
jgi:hypothetical protein